MAPPKRTEDERSQAREIGARIRERRRARGLSAEALAVKARLTSDHLLHLERGEHVAYAHTIRRIAKALGVSEQWLLTGDKP